MSSDVYSTLGPKSLTETPQTEAADARQEMNHAGGFTFTLDRAGQARRFLILGSDAGTYYAGARAHTLEATTPILQMAHDGDLQLLELIRDVSLNGLAPRQQPTLLALAVACASPDDAMRRQALDMVPDVCRTFTMLTTFLNYVKTFRGMGRGLRSAIAKFYETKSVDKLGLQMVKYRQRDGWTHRDVLRVAHPSADNAAVAALYDWACGRKLTIAQHELLPVIVREYEKAQVAETGLIAAGNVREGRLPWEAIPDAVVNDPDVLKELAVHMPAGALIRQLPRFARAGLTGGPFGGDFIAAKLLDEDFIRNSRVHPYQVLVAKVVYEQGRSHLGRGEAWTPGRGEAWTPSRKIIDALEGAFESSFKNIEPSGKKIGLFLDVSGSMSWSTIANSPLSAREGSAAMAMATLRSEPDCYVAGFTGGRAGGWDTMISMLPVSARDSLTSAVRAISGLPFGGTDCSLPMQWALKNAPTTEVFIVYTDNETWAGRVHPHEALRTYRKATGINAKLIVVGMTATKFTIADPSDPGMLDVVGFDASAPQIMSAFAKGEI